MKRHLALSFLAALSLAASAQVVQFFTPGTVRVSHCPDNTKCVTERKSEVVIAQPEKVKVSVKEADGAKVYKSALLTVTVKDGNVTFADAKGNLLAKEGATAFTPIAEGPDKGAYRVKQTFCVDADEGIYGVGLLQNGKMSQRGEDRRMIQENLDDYAHFFQSIKGYGVFWDNYSPTHLNTPDEGKAGEIVLESEVGKLSDYYFIYGGNADGVIKAMRHLSGKAPMMPLWTYGFHQSRERYKSSRELLDVVDTYRKKQIPLDGIIQDWQYWGSNYTWNAMEFINEDFKNAQDMINHVHNQNAHMSISIWASFGPQTKQFKELSDKGLLFSFETWPQSGLPFWPPRMDYPSGVKVYDCYSPEARDIYWKYLSNMHKMGIDAWWMDSTDPDHHSYKDSDLDEMCSMGSYRSVRNIFPLKTVGGVYDHQREVDSSKRVFILTRSYFAGQQRYGANTWSGDVGSSWENLRKQVPICLNYTLTAAPHVNSDIGGFFANSYNTQGSNSATRNPQFQELYVRWMQFGAFCPMMRSHGTEVYREVYHYGKEGEPVYEALVNTVKLRYRLLPYIYSQAWQVTKNDDSFMRALFMDYRNDRNTWNNNSEFVFGHNILVCPVLHPLYTEEKIIKTDAMSGWDAKPMTGEVKGGYPQPQWSTVHNYEVYLPAGAKWYDFWATAGQYVGTEAVKGASASPVNGGQKINAAAPLAYSPVYVKAGSIIPVGPDVQYASQKAWDNLDIVVYPGANAEFTLYEDEGDNYNYEKGAYSEIKMKWNDKAQKLTIEKHNGAYPGMLTSRTFNVHVVGGKSKSVTYTGKAVAVAL